jgi:hypothetical protein
MKRRSLFKYFSERRWAEAFMDGSVLFRSLAYFRDLEDAAVRGDSNEGRSIFRPKGGLAGTNHTQGRGFVFPNHALVSTAKQGEIFVFCTSRALSPLLREEFQANECVEITDVPAWCARVRSALPEAATFPGRPGHKQIGKRVEYYDEADAPGTRWALPDSIGLAKLRPYAYQEEFRLMFSLTDALDFEKITVQIEPVGSTATRDPSEHHDYMVTAPSLRDICKLLEF